MEYEQIIKYRTSDGQEFDTEDEAQKHISNYENIINKYRINIDIELPYLLNKTYMNFKFFIQGGNYLFFRVHNLYEYKELYDALYNMEYISNRIEIHPNADLFADNDNILMAEINHMKRLMNIKSVIDDAESLKQKCLAYINDSEVFCNRIKELINDEVEE